MMSPEELLSTVGIVLPSYTSGRYTVLCPRCSHLRKGGNRKHPVLGVTIDGERVHWGCNHCDWTGPQPGDAPRGNGNGSDRDGIIIHPYGAELRKVRFPRGHTPRCIWEHLDVDRWVKGTGGRPTNQLLYRIDEALAQDGPIAVPEGEGDVDRLWSLGIPATCNAHGASEPGKTPKWTKAHSEQLRGRDVVVLNDNDEPGYAHAEVVRTLTAAVARRLGRLDLKEHWPGDSMPAGFDVSDMLEAKAIDGETLKELITAALPEPEKPKLELTIRYGEDAAVLQPMGTIVAGFLHSGSATMLYGPPKSGKSFLATDCFLSIAAGDPHWMGHKIFRTGPVLYVACEGHAGFPKRLAAAKIRRALFGLPARFALAQGRPHLVELKDHGRVAVPHPDAVIAAIASMPEKPIAVAIDTVFRAMGTGNVNNSDHIGAFLTAIGAIMDLGIAVILVHHETKAGGSPLGSQALMAGTDTIVRTQNLEGNRHAWEIEFAKDDATTEGQPFDLEIIELGLDPDGQPASSCVVVPVAEKIPKKQRPLKEHHALFLEHLRALMGELGKQISPLPGMPLCTAMTRKELRSGLLQRGWFPATLPGEPIVLRNVMNRELNALEALATRRTIAFNSEHVWML